MKLIKLRNEMNEPVYINSEEILVVKPASRNGYSVVSTTYGDILLVIGEPNGVVADIEGQLRCESDESW